jgi:[methyl-Co(III) methanol-specific corrinoid protein]:coenzyme M methyltransferase
LERKKMKRLVPKKRVFNALSGEKVDRTPATSVAGCGGTVTVGMQEATGIYWPEAHKDPEKMAKLARASHELTGLESVRVPFDFVVEPEALGCQIRWYDKPDLVPSVVGHPYETPDDLEIPDNFPERGRIPVVLDAINILKNEVGEFLPVASVALGPFSLAGELAGLDSFLRWVVLKPAFVKEFVSRATEVTIEYAKAQFQAGSDIVAICEPLASLEVLSVDMFREFVKPALTKIADRLRGIRVLHICGRSNNEFIQETAEIGFNGVSLEEGVDVAGIKPLVGDVKILGNVSSKNTLVFGSPDDVKDEARKALTGGVDLLEPTCGISPITPLENIKALVEATRFKSEM